MTTATTTHPALSPITPKLRARAEKYLTRKPNERHGVTSGRIWDLAYDKAGREAWLERIQPTGQEDVELMATCLAYAEEERVSARKAGRRSRFQMSTWNVGMIFKDAAGGPPPLTCGTTACLAGTAAAFTLAPNELMTSGEVRRIEDPRLYAAKRDQALAGGVPPTMMGSSFAVESVERRGTDVLGLNRNQAKVLFFLTDAQLPSVKLVASYVTGYDLTRVGL